MADIVIAPTRLDAVSDLDGFCHRSLDTAQKVTVDLSGLSFVKPPGIIGILMLIEHLMGRGRAGMLFRPPSNPKVLDYLKKIGFFQAVTDVAGTSWPEPFQGKGSPAIRPMIPVTRFHSSQDVDKLANSMAEKFRTEMIGLAMLQQPCHVIFSELADNVLHHAQSAGGFAMAQEYHYQTKREIEIAVGDTGRGIRAALSAVPDIAPKLTDDLAAIRLAMMDGVTSVDDSYRGYGLGYVKQEVSSSRERRLTLRSGSGSLTIYGSGQVRGGNCLHFCGTIGHTVIGC